jgi:2-polyprenyl-6-methoxyphenol hydroxylase-like FAD-dependent oxidoreductase
MRSLSRRSATQRCQISRNVLPIVIIGGGPAGSICAQQLALRGHRVILFEKQLKRERRPAETCTAHVRRTVEIACAATIPSDVAAPLRGFWSAWGGELEKYAFPFWQAGEGAIVDRALLDEWLLNIAEQAGATVHRGCQIIEGHRSDATWLLTVRRGCVSEEVEACFVVEAAGAVTRSAVQSSASRFFTDRQVCLSATLRTEIRSDLSAGVESCPAGWWYTVKPNSGSRTMSLFTDADSALLQVDRQTLFLRALEQTSYMRKLVDGLSWTDSLRTASSRGSIRRLLWKGSWVAVGDSARTIDPLSGGGIGRAAKDAIEAAYGISQAISSSDFKPLRTYAVDRANDFNGQLAVQRTYHARERRWNTQEFWKRRNSMDACVRTHAGPS